MTSSTDTLFKYVPATCSSWQQHPAYMEACRTVPRAGDPTSYSPAHPPGATLTDATTFKVGLALMDPNNLPEILYQIFPCGAWKRFRESPRPDQKQDSQGNPMFERYPRPGQAARPILDFEILGGINKISTKVPWQFVELLFRLDPRLQWNDIDMLMEQSGRRRLQAKKAKFINSLNTICVRGRQTWSMIAWRDRCNPKKSSGTRDSVLSAFSPTQLSLNSSRGSTPGRDFNGNIVPLPMTRGGRRIKSWPDPNYVSGYVASTRPTSRPRRASMRLRSSKYEKVPDSSEEESDDNSDGAHAEAASARESLRSEDSQQGNEDDGHFDDESLSFATPVYESARRLRQKGKQREGSDTNKNPGNDYHPQGRLSKKRILRDDGGDPRMTSMGYINEEIDSGYGMYRNTLKNQALWHSPWESNGLHDIGSPNGHFRSSLDEADSHPNPHSASAPGWTTPISITNAGSYEFGVEARQGDPSGSVDRSYVEFSTLNANDGGNNEFGWSTTFDSTQEICHGSPSARRQQTSPTEFLEQAGDMDLDNTEVQMQSAVQGHYEDGGLWASWSHELKFPKLPSTFSTAPANQHSQLIPHGLPHSHIPDISNQCQSVPESPPISSTSHLWQSHQATPHAVCGNYVSDPDSTVPTGFSENATGPSLPQEAYSYAPSIEFEVVTYGPSPPRPFHGEPSCRRLGNPAPRENSTMQMTDAFTTDDSEFGNLYLPELDDTL